MNCVLDPLPIVTVVGTAAVVTRAPLRCPARLRRSVLGGSGVLMSATAVGIGQPVRLVSHVARDADGDRIRAWANRNGVALAPESRNSRSVHLVEDFIEGQGVIAAGTTDPGPTRAQLRLAVAVSGWLFVGDTSTQALALLVQLVRYRRRANLPTPLIVANLSAATTRAWPQARALWGLADVVTIGEQELEHLGVTHSEARRWLTENATFAVTNRSEPVLLYSTAGELKAEIPPLKDSADTMGAGDAFTVALVDALRRGLPMDRSADRAIRIAQLMCRVDSIEELPQRSWAVGESGPDPPRLEDQP